MNIISSLHYLCLLNKFSDIITIQVLAVGILHAEATTYQDIDTSHPYRDKCLAEIPILPNPKKPFEPRLLITISINEVLTPIRELGTQESYHEYQYGQNFTYKTPSEKSNSLWYTPYPESDQRSSQRFEIPDVWGGNKTYVLLIETPEMASDPKAPEAMEWQEGEAAEREINVPPSKLQAWKPP